MNKGKIPITTAWLLRSNALSILGGAGFSTVHPEKGLAPQTHCQGSELPPPFPGKEAEG